MTNRSLLLLVIVVVYLISAFQVSLNDTVGNLLGALDFGVATYLAVTLAFTWTAPHMKDRR